MKISKKDALQWFEFFAMLPEEEELMVKQQEIVYATFAQIEEAIDHRNEQLMEEISGLKTLEKRTLYVNVIKLIKPNIRPDSGFHVNQSPVLYFY